MARGTRNPRVAPVGAGAGAASVSAKGREKPQGRETPLHLRAWHSGSAYVLLCCAGCAPAPAPSKTIFKNPSGFEINEEFFW